MRWIMVSILVLLLLIAAVVVWFVVLNQRVNLENQTLESTMTAVPTINPTETDSSPIATSSAVLLRSPLVNSVVTSPLQIEGQAPGTWFFEAQMSARLMTVDGREIAEVPLQAEGEWMTENLVPFSGTMRFSPPPNTTQLNLIIEKANPSGLPENEQTFTVPVRLEE